MGKYRHLAAKTLVATIGVAGLGAFLAVPASANSGNDPCGLAVSFICRFVPIAPDLDGDVDLTTQLPPADSAVPPMDSRPPADICANGCV
jgi:hypothetical protein